MPAVPHSRAVVSPPFASSSERCGVVSPRSSVGNGSPRAVSRTHSAVPVPATKRSENCFLGREKILYKISPHGVVFLFDVCASLDSRQVTVSTAYSSMAGEAEPMLKSRKAPWQLRLRRAPCSVLRPRAERSAVRGPGRNGCCGQGVCCSLCGCAGQKKQRETNALHHPVIACPALPCPALHHPALALSSVGSGPHQLIELLNLARHCGSLLVTLLFEAFGTGKEK